MDSLTKSPAANAGFCSVANTANKSEQTISQTILRWIAVGLWMWLIWIFGSKDFAARETFSIIRFIIGFFFPGWPDANPEMMQMLHMTNRKIAHFLEYGILSLLWYRALLGNSRTLLSILFSILWACVDEYHQSLIPDRSGSIGDVGIDTFGAITAQIIVIKHVLKLKH